MTFYGINKYLLILGLAFAWSCTKSEAPYCINQKIKKQNPLKVYQNKTEDNGIYYEFFPDCCDQYVELYDSDCGYVCAPSGGITGGGDGDCPEIKYKSKQLIYEK
ncbi:MAG: DUF6970 domain-containing protein [Putridiphycobacter sp.]